MHDQIPISTVRDCSAEYLSRPTAEPPRIRREAQRELVELIESAVLFTELKAMREQIAALTSELRSRKQRAAKRVRSRRQRLEREPDPVYRPTELDIARARRALR